jgi:hypothetical protein
MRDGGGPTDLPRGARQLGWGYADGSIRSDYLERHRSVWDMLAARRAPALGIGLLSGGYGPEELERAGAYRVYEDPAGLLKHIDEVIRT